MDSFDKDVDLLCKLLAEKTDDIIQHRLQHANFDKSYNGYITALKFDNTTDKSSDNYNKYTIKFNGMERDFVINDGYYHEVGEKVVVYVFTNDFNIKSVECIENYKKYPINITYDETNEIITMDFKNSFTDTYQLTVEGKGTEDEKVTKITLPNGEVINLSGF